FELEVISARRDLLQRSPYLGRGHPGEGGSKQGFGFGQSEGFGLHSFRTTYEAMEEHRFPGIFVHRIPMGMRVAGISRFGIAPAAFQGTRIDASHIRV